MYWKGVYIECSARSFHSFIERLIFTYYLRRIIHTLVVCMRTNDETINEWYGRQRRKSDCDELIVTLNIPNEQIHYVIDG